MHFGLFNLMTLPEGDATTAGVLADTMALVELADEAGFEIAWFAEHHFSNYSISPSPLMMAAHAAARTKRIRLGAAVLVLPLYHPLRMVQEVGLLDLQSEGRAVIGLGSGYQKFEFDRFDQSLDDRTAVSLEAWDILEQALTTGVVDYQGSHFSFPPTPILVRPVGDRVPEIFVTGTTSEVLTRCARGGHTPFVTGGFRGNILISQLRAHIDKIYGEAGVDPLTAPFAVQQYVHVTDSKAEAEDFIERARYVGRIVAQMRAGDPVMEGAFIKAPVAPDEPSTEQILANTIIGDPQSCAEKVIETIKLFGVTHFNCFMLMAGLPRARALKSLERFAGEVIPLVEKELGPLKDYNSARSPELSLAGE